MSWQSKPDRLLLRPQHRLSRTRTSARSWKYSAICRPMKPAPPVIKTRIPEWCRAGHESSDRCVAKLEYRPGDPFSRIANVRQIVCNAANLCEKFFVRRQAGWSWGCVTAVDSNGRTIFVANALQRESTLRSVTRRLVCGLGTHARLRTQRLDRQ